MIELYLSLKIDHLGCKGVQVRLINPRSVKNTILDRNTQFVDLKNRKISNWSPVLNKIDPKIGALIPSLWVYSNFK